MNFKKRAGVAAALIVVFSALQSAGAAYSEGLRLVPAGDIVGIRIENDGPMVVSFAGGNGAGAASPAFEAGILPGDVIKAVNGQKVANLADFANFMKLWDGGEINVTVERDGARLDFTLVPKSKSTGGAELGVCVRDGMVGLGTVTFYDPASGAFGALGHGVNDVDTGTLLPLKSGAIMKAEVSGAVKGKAGSAGEITGSFDMENPLGSIFSNTVCGIFGTATDLIRKNISSLPAAPKSAIETGSAKIINCVSGSAREYEIQINRVYPDDGSGRDMLISITDPALIDVTGGIVQGMSGSPIIQNGKLVGAVTHVLLNDPTKGYGISIETMLDAMEAPAA